MLEKMRTNVEQPHQPTLLSFEGSSISVNANAVASQGLSRGARGVSLWGLAGGSLLAASRSSNNQPNAVSGNVFPLPPPLPVSEGDPKFQTTYAILESRFPSSCVSSGQSKSKTRCSGDWNGCDGMLSQSLFTTDVIRNTAGSTVLKSSGEQKHSLSGMKENVIAEKGEALGDALLKVQIQCKDTPVHEREETPPVEVNSPLEQPHLATPVEYEHDDSNIDEDDTGYTEDEVDMGCLTQAGLNALLGAMTQDPLPLQQRGQPETEDCTMDETQLQEDLLVGSSGVAATPVTPVDREAVEVTTGGTSNAFEVSTNILEAQLSVGITSLDSAGVSETDDLASEPSHGSDLDGIGCSVHPNDITVKQDDSSSEESGTHQDTIPPERTARQRLRSSVCSNSCVRVASFPAESPIACSQGSSCSQSGAQMAEVLCISPNFQWSQPDADQLITCPSNSVDVITMPEVFTECKASGEKSTLRTECSSVEKEIGATSARTAVTPPPLNSSFSAGHPVSPLHRSPSVFPSPDQSDCPIIQGGCTPVEEFLGPTCTQLLSPINQAVGVTTENFSAEITEQACETLLIVADGSTPCPNQEATTYTSSARRSLSLISPRDDVEAVLSTSSEDGENTTDRAVAVFQVDEEMCSEPPSPPLMCFSPSEFTPSGQSHNDAVSVSSDDSSSVSISTVHSGATNNFLRQDRNTDDSSNDTGLNVCDTTNGCAAISTDESSSDDGLVQPPLRRQRSASVMDTPFPPSSGVSVTDARTSTVVPTPTAVRRNAHQGRPTSMSTATSRAGRTETVTTIARSSTSGTTAGVSSIAVVPSGCPNYSSMPVAELRRLAAGFGLRAAPKPEMVSILQNIWQATHVAAASTGASNRVSALVDDSSPTVVIAAPSRRGQRGRGRGRGGVQRQRGRGRRGPPGQSAVDACPALDSSGEELATMLSDLIKTDSALYDRILMFDVIELDTLYAQV